MEMVIGGVDSFPPMLFLAICQDDYILASTTGRVDRRPDMGSRCAMLLVKPRRSSEVRLGEVDDASRAVPRDLSPPYQTDPVIPISGEKGLQAAGAILTVIMSSQHQAVMVAEDSVAQH